MSLRHTAAGLLATTELTLPVMFHSLFGPLDQGDVDARVQRWAKQLVEQADIDLDVRGRENGGDGSEPLIVMSNHQSLFDVPLLFLAVRGRLRMVAKAELFRIPFFGRGMLASGVMKIDRRNHEQAVETLKAQGHSLLSGGTRVWLAPEGTRSKTGALGPFKSGGFYMAHDNGVRILPVAIQGTRDVLPTGAVRVNPGKRVVITVLAPVDPAAYGHARRKELIAEVRRRIAEALGQDPTATPA
jgi:1-acyl-sn-glycerol-3-phosphate acyltransferase